MVLAVVVDGARFDMSDQGLFGFLRPENLVVSFVFYAFMAGFWGQCGYVISCKYFPPVVIVNCLLLEPILS